MVNIFHVFCVIRFDIRLICLSWFCVLFAFHFVSTVRFTFVPFSLSYWVDTNLFFSPRLLSSSICFFPLFFCSIFWDSFFVVLVVLSHLNAHWIHSPNHIGHSSIAFDVVNLSGCWISNSFTWHDFHCCTISCYIFYTEMQRTMSIFFDSYCESKVKYLFAMSLNKSGQIFFCLKKEDTVDDIPTIIHVPNELISSNEFWRTRFFEQ